MEKLAPKVTLIMADFESQRFSWTAFGLTKKKAIAALIKGLKKHGRLTYGLSEKWFLHGETEAEFVKNNVGFTKIQAGACYRDKTKM